METFRRMQSNGEFLEYAEVHKNMYGTSWESFNSIINEKKIPIMEIDVQGVRNVKALAETLQWNPNYIFIAPPRLELLQERLQRRFLFLQLS